MDIENQVKQQMYKDEFPLKLALLGKEYDVDFVYEDRYIIKVCIGYRNSVVRHYVYKKDVDGYINVVYLKNIICRNLEGRLYWNEVEDCEIEEDDRMMIFDKYWRKSVLLDVLGDNKSK